MSIVTPRPASTIVLLRDRTDGGGPEVFMQVRHGTMDFAAGALVFPGGSLGEDDHAIARAGNELIEGASEAGDADRLAFRVAAIREVFEECGILLARRQGSPDLLDHDEVAAFAGELKSAVKGDKSAFSRLLARRRMRLAADQVVPFAHWITPVVRPKRFDTHFFVARAPAAQIGGHDGVEAVESCWITPAGALAATAEGRYKLVFVTRMNLVRLTGFATAEDILAAARRTAIHTVCPEIVTGADGQRFMRIPAAAGYGGELFPATDMAPI